MKKTRPLHSTCCTILVLGLGLGSAQQIAHASSILILTGSGTSSLTAPISGAGFTVINGTLSPGQIAANLAADTVGVYIWNDGSLGNTFSPANPALSFSAADQTALTGFAATHGNLILDGLSWRANGNIDEQNFSKNEVIQLVNAGGGIVLGADDASGALIVQHVNQVAGWLGINPFSGVYSTSPSSQVFGGSLLTSPNVVNPQNVIGTTTYSEVPSGLQPNGTFLATAIFGEGTPYPGFGSPVLPPETFNGITYQNVNHIVTTNIRGGGINNPPELPEPGILVSVGIGLLGLCLSRSRRNA